MSALSMPSASRIPTKSATAFSREYGATPSGRSERPKPRWSGAMARKPLRIDQLAKMTGMGVSTLHRHFHELTDMSPIQYQKRLRLHEARRLML
jgi:hypothetical protein